MRRSKNEPATTGFGSLQQEMNRLFDDFFGHAPDFFGGTAFPAITTSETDGQVIVTAEIPGVKPDDLDITVKDHVVTIKGEKKEEKKDEKENVFRMERSYGSFIRQVALPAEVDPAGAESKLDHGVLELRLPKLGEKHEAKSVRIKVK
jgi:HSP20 family protein